MHAPEITECFLRSLLPRLQRPPDALWTQPEGGSGLFGTPILSTLQGQGSPSALGPISIVAFSAGVVGAAQAISRWQELGGQLACLIAIDGWGVPLGGDYPIYRLSHDAFTHWSCGWLGSGAVNFYADPAVEHLSLWQAPDQVVGWCVDKRQQTRTNAADFIGQSLADTNPAGAISTETHDTPFSIKNIRDT